MLLNRSSWQRGAFKDWSFSRKYTGIIGVAGLAALAILLTWRGEYFSDSSARNQTEKPPEQDSHSVLYGKMEAIGGKQKVAANQVEANKLGLEEYQKKWRDSLASRADDQARFFDHGGWVTAMVLKGYSLEALDLITKTYGPGKQRCELIQKVFRSESDVETAEHIYKSLEYGDEMNAACEGIGSQLGLSSTIDEVDLEKFAFLGDRIDTMLAAFAERFVVQNIDGSAEDVSKVISDVFDLPMSKEAARCVLLKIYQFVPFDSWHMISVGRIELSNAERQGVMARMFHADPLKAMEKLVASKDGEANIPGGFNLWLAMDATKPIAWLQGNAGKLTASQKDHAIQGIAEYSASQGDCDIARQWVGQIADPVLKKRVEGQVWSMERDIVRREVSMNPESSIQSMISGDSRHQDYWIEEAFSTWAAKDPAKAQVWYQENWARLPANKSQFLAAALAKQAADQGETATARQWAAHIQDAKTKQRIEAGIAEAEAAKNR